VMTVNKLDQGDWKGMLMPSRMALK